MEECSAALSLSFSIYEIRTMTVLMLWSCQPKPLKAFEVPGSGLASTHISCVQSLFNAVTRTELKGQPMLEGERWGREEGKERESRLPGEQGGG